MEIAYFVGKDLHQSVVAARKKFVVAEGKAGGVEAVVVAAAAAGACRKDLCPFVAVIGKQSAVA